MNFLVLASLALTASAAPMSYKCPLIQLQEDIDFTRLSGDWDLRYTNSTEEQHCYNFNLYDVNPAEKKMKMNYNYIVTEDVDLIHRKGIVADSMMMHKDIQVTWGDKVQEGSGEYEEEYISYREDYIATDYETYLVIAECDDVTGELTINVFSRTKTDSNGKQYRVNIGQEKRKEVNAHIGRLGSHIQLLDRVFYKRCDRAERNFYAAKVEA